MLLPICSFEQVGGRLARIEFETGGVAEDNATVRYMLMWTLWSVYHFLLLFPGLVCILTIINLNAGITEKEPDIVFVGDLKVLDGNLVVLKLATLKVNLVGLFYSERHCLLHRALTFR